MMFNSKRASAVLALAMASVMGMSGVALADNINDSIEANAAITLTNASPSGSFTIKVAPNNGQVTLSDGTKIKEDDNCNIDANEYLDVVLLAPDGFSLSSTNADFTASTKTMRFNAGECNNNKSVTVTRDSTVVDVVSNAVTVSSWSGTAANTTDEAYSNNVNVPLVLDNDGDGTRNSADTTPNGETTDGGTEESTPPADTTAPQIGYTLNPAEPNGNDDWYKSGDVVLDWTVTDNESTATPIGCEDRTISVDQLATTYRCEASSSGGTATPVEVSVKRDATDPAVATPVAADVTGTAGDDGWYTSSVDVTFRRSDATSGLVGLANDTVTLSTDGANQTANSRAVNDQAGNTLAAGNKSVPGISIDKTDPAVATPVAADVTGTAGDDGWYTSPVEVAFHGSDATSGLVGPADRTVTVSTDGANRTANSPEFKDVAGNTTDAGDQSVTGLKIDQVAPAVDTPVATDVSGTLGADGWYVSPVDVTFHRSDATSGVVGDLDDTVTLSTDGANQTANSRAVKDVAGNTTAAGDKSVTGLKIDQTPPTDVAFSGSLSGAYPFGTVPAQPTCSATDTTSGASCAVTGYKTTVGTHTLTATATNGAGLTSSATATYTVSAYGTKGFHQPVDMGTTFNTTKAGNTVPLKFEVFSDSSTSATELIETSRVAALKYVKLTATGTVTGDEIETLASGSTSLRYDAAAPGQFIYNWKTPAAGDYRVTVYLNDLRNAADPLSGTTISALFRTR